MKQITVELVIFLILFIFYCDNCAKIYKNDKTFNKIKITFVLIAIQVLAFIGNIMYKPFYLDFSGLLNIGNIAEGIGFNVFTIISHSFSLITLSLTIVIEVPAL